MKRSSYFILRVLLCQQRQGFTASLNIQEGDDMQSACSFYYVCNTDLERVTAFWGSESSTLRVTKVSHPPSRRLSKRLDDASIRDQTAHSVDGLAHDWYTSALSPPPLPTIWQGSTTHRFETKLLILSVVSRVIGTHQLLVLHFYPYIQKYLQPHQRDATKLLAIAVQVNMLPLLMNT
eukprot:1191789-Prorocentrum_minimum.AAC.2